MSQIKSNFQARLLSIAPGIALATSVAAAMAQPVDSRTSNAIPKFSAVPAASSQVPAEVLGAWQVQLDGRSMKLKTNFSIEIKVNDSNGSSPIAVVSYFAGDPKRPSTICRSQLSFASREGENLIFDESLNYRGGKDSCPIWDQLSMQPKDGHLLLQWRAGQGNKHKVKIEIEAFRSTGGMECRLVGGDSGSGGQEWCRDSEGNWSAKAR